MRIYEVYYSDMQVNAKFKTLLPDTAENFVVRYSDLPRMEYMRMVLETCIHNFRSDILYSLSRMSRVAGDEALISLYNGCVMLNPVLDADTWTSIAHSFNIFNRKHTEIDPVLELPPGFNPDEDEFITESKPQPRTERKKKVQPIPYAKFINLHNHLSEKIIGQEQAVRQVTSALKRAQVKLNDPNRPLGVFFFCGPSGVGKTKLAKVLQEYLFQNIDLVRIDCGEFQHKHENQKLIGCFTPEAKVITKNNGILPIAEVNIRMEVLTHAGEYKKVKCKHVGIADDDVLTFKVKYGRNTFTCTKNHKIWAIKDAGQSALNAKFYSARDLEIGDYLLKPSVAKNGVVNYTFHEINSIETSHYKGRVVDLTIDNHSTYTVEGFAVHNSPPGFIGHDEGGQLTKELLKTPQTVVLIDEAEKAHPDFWHTFLKTFDDGFMSDSKGNKVSFKDAIVIITSNLGNDTVTSETYRRTAGFTGSVRDSFNSKTIPKRDMVERVTMEAIRKHFKPEFLNRLDEIIIFNHLELEDYRQIAEMEFHSISDKLIKQQYYIAWDEDAVDMLVKLSSKAVEGARGMAKIRREYIENKIADALIDRKNKKGTIFNILATADDDFIIEIQ